MPLAVREFLSIFFHVEKLISLTKETLFCNLAVYA